MYISVSKVYQYYTAGWIYSSHWSNSSLQVQTVQNISMLHCKSHLLTKGKATPGWEVGCSYAFLSLIYHGQTFFSFCRLGSLRKWSAVPEYRKGKGRRTILGPPGIWDISGHQPALAARRGTQWCRAPSCKISAATRACGWGQPAYQNPAKSS